MIRAFLAVAVACTLPSLASVTAQEAAQPGDPLRIVILVDNSEWVREDMPPIRRGLQQFVDALPPNHELMLVTTGGEMNIRVQPTFDYLDVMEAVGEITHRPSGGNAMIGSVEEIHNRYLRTVERRYPMFVILTGDGADTSQRITSRSINEVMRGLTASSVIVNAVILSTSRVGLIRGVVLDMVKRTGGAQQSVVISSALPGRMKVIAQRIAEQYKKLSPGRDPVEPLRR